MLAQETVQSQMSVTHPVRRSVLERETTWRVDGEALERSVDGATERFALKDVRGIRVAYDPTRADSARYRCDLDFGKRSLRIVSSHYRGFADFEDRGASYSRLVRALVAGAERAKPAVVLSAGKSRIVYVAELGFLAAMLALLFVVLWNVGLSVSEVVMAKMVATAAMVPVCVVYVRKNRPRRFGAASIPQDLMPAGGTK